MKAAIWKGISTIEIKRLPIPKPVLPTDVTVRVLGCGVCVADTYILRGAVPLAKPPVVLGHEIFGEVYQVGPGVDHLKVGDKVCIDPMVTCGRCVYCLQGRPNLCRSMTSVGFRLDGGFQQFVLAPSSHVHPIAPVSTKAGVLAQPLACVLHGHNKLTIPPDGTVMILGAGSTGLMWTQVVKHGVSTTTLIQSEVFEPRRQLAQQLGADYTVNPLRENLRERVLQIASEGVDIIIDASGSSVAVQEALPLLKRGGTMMIFGICCPGENLIVPAYDVFENEWTITGTKMLPHTMKDAVKVLEAGFLDSERIVTDSLGLKDIEKGLEWVLDRPEMAVKFFVDPWLGE